SAQGVRAAEEAQLAAQHRLVSPFRFRRATSSIWARVRSMIIERRFRGPPDSGNGGYSCGVIGVHLGGTAEVTLRVPPPLERELRIVREGPGAKLLEGETLVAEAAPALLDIEAPAPVSFAEAEKASRGYPWFEGHPFPGCFVCGPERAADDGLRILPGPVEGREIAAAPWIPEASLAGERGLVRPEVVWAALDCPSWFGFYCFTDWRGKALLGRLAARID